MRRLIIRASVMTAVSIRASAPVLSFAVPPRAAAISRFSLSGIPRRRPQQYAPGSRFGPAIRPCQTVSVAYFRHGIRHLRSTGRARRDWRCLACERKNWQPFGCRGAPVTELTENPLFASLRPARLATSFSPSPDNRRTTNFRLSRSHVVQASSRSKSGISMARATAAIRRS